MMGLEGIIERVDRRKGRAKIRLTLNENSLLVDLAFDVIESAEEKNGQ
jgi:transcriptional antiterminator NusG